MSKIDRRGFIKLAGLGGGIVFASSLSRGFGLNALGSVIDDANGRAEDDFYFVQLSDTHWGFAGPKVNPDAEGTLKKAVQAVNSLEGKVSMPASITVVRPPRIRIFFIS